MRFMVIGTDSAGQPVECPLEARSVDEAEFLAKQQGINVSKIMLGSAARPAAAPAPAPAPAAPIAPAAATVARRVEPAPMPAAVPFRPEPIPVAARIEAAPEPMPASPVPGATVQPPPARRATLGMISLALGGTALLFCWIPVVGMISPPLCIAGLVAGIAGLFAAAFFNQTLWGLGMLSRVAVPAGGAALSAVALAASLLVAPGADSVAQVPSDRPAAREQDNEGQRAAPAKQGRSLSIVTSHNTAAPEGLFSGKQPEGPAAVLQAPAVARIGDVELRVVGSTIMHVPLMGDQGRPQGVSATPLLMLRVELRNTGSEPIMYRTLVGDGEVGLEPGATLRDAAGRLIKAAQFGTAIIPSGHVATDTLYPGRSLTDVLVFDRPADETMSLILEAPGRSVGAEGTFPVHVPVPTVR